MKGTRKTLTYSRTVSRALEDFVRLAKARKIYSLAGCGLWDGNLSAMRNDVLMLADSAPAGPAPKDKKKPKK